MVEKFTGHRPVPPYKQARPVLVVSAAYSHFL